MEVSRKWQKNRGNERKVGYVRENRENVVISAKIRTGAVQSLIPLTPQYMPMGGPYYPGEYPEPGPQLDIFSPPSPLKGPRSEASLPVPKCRHTEVTTMMYREPDPSESTTAPVESHCSPSPDIRDDLEESDGNDEEPPILIQIPQLNGPLAFTRDALQNWGGAHLDHSEQSTQFRSQLCEWKTTKVELHKILAKVYKDTRVLKEHVVTNQVTQEHMYMLHIQVKRTAKQIREVS